MGSTCCWFIHTNLNIIGAMCRPCRENTQNHLLHTSWRFIVVQHGWSSGGQRNRYTSIFHKETYLSFHAITRHKSQGLKLQSRYIRLVKVTLIKVLTHITCIWVFPEQYCCTKFTIMKPNLHKCINKIQIKQNTLQHSIICNCCWASGLNMHDQCVDFMSQGCHEI